MNEKNAEIISSVFEAGNGPKALELLVNMYFNKRSYTKDDTHETAYKEGQRDVVRHIVSMCEVASGRKLTPKVIHD